MVWGKKEEKDFKDVLDLYEKKAYKKAIKLADSLLKREPGHGDTTAVRGLCARQSGEEDPATASAAVSKLVRGNTCGVID